MMYLRVTVIIFALAIADAQFSPTRRCRNTQFECNNGECISKSYWCDGRRHGRYCSDYSDQRDCGSYPNCASYGQAACDVNRKCIPSKWLCDDYRDCSDGSDEQGCVDGYKLKDRLAQSREKARSWLLKQRRINFGWEGHTHRAITALYLSNTKQFFPANSDSKLMIKQLQIQLSKTMFKGDSIPTHEMALYVHSFLSTCLDPRKFQYHDLVQELQRSLEKSDSFNPFVSLALCNSNSSLSSKSVQHLMEIMNKPCKPEWIEQQALAAMTLICLQKRASNISENVSGDTNITDSLSNNSSSITSNFTTLQRSNGSFGSFYTTALVLQALQADGNDGYGWNQSKAVRYLTSEQRSDGSFGDDILSSYLILPVLNDRSLVDLGNVDCQLDDSRIRNLTVKEELDSINSVSQRVTYTVLVGIRREITFSTTFTVPVNTSFHDAMRLAEELDPRYKFRYVPYAWGNYVYSIFGIANDPEAGQYWQLFRIKGKQFNLVNKAPDRLVTENNGRYVYWYRPTSSAIDNKAEANEIYFHENLVEL